MARTLRNTLRGLGMVATVGGGYTVTWRSVSNKAYQVLFKNDLSDPAWTVIGPSNIVANSSLTSYVDSSASGISQRFYRVALVLQDP